MGQILFLLVPLLLLYLREPPASSPSPDQAPGILVASLLSAALAVAVHRVSLGALGAWMRLRPASAQVRADRIGRLQGFVFGGLLGLYYIQINRWSLPEALGAALLPPETFLLGDLLLLLPFLLPFLAVRVSTMRRVSVLRGSPPPRIGEALLGSLRLAGVVMAPQLLYLNLYGLLFFGPGPLAAWAEEHPAVGMVSAAALFFVVFAASPAMVRYLFPREDMARVPGLLALDRSLKALGEAAGLRVRRIFVWRTGAQRVANAAVAGVLGRYQRFFITDHLLRRLEPEEIHAVMAHELGHATLRHPLYNFFLAVSAGVFLAWSLLALLPWVEGLDLGRGWGPPLLLGLDALYIFTVFGFFLRRFEHQADMVAVALTGGPEPFSRALVALGHLALVPDRRRSLTHPSIRQRLAWLDVRLARAPAQDWIRRFRRSNLLLLSVLLVLYGATLALVELA